MQTGDATLRLMTRCLALDLDGTLVDSVPDLTAALNRLMTPRGIAGFSRAEVVPMVGDGVAVLVERAFAARDRVPDAGAIAELTADYTAHAADESRLFDGVADTLHALVEDGWRLAVCTNKPEIPARALLDALGVADLFAAIGGGDSFLVRKPNPAHLLATLDAAGADRARCVMVGDHRNDVAVALGAGVPAIFAAWGYGPPAMGEGAAAVAAQFAEVPKLAARLVGR